MRLIGVGLVVFFCHSFITYNKKEKEKKKQEAKLSVSGTQCPSVNEKWNNIPHYPDNKRWWEGQHPEGTFNHDWARRESCGIYLPQSFKQNHQVTFKGNIFQIIYTMTWVPIKAALANRKKVTNGANVEKFMNDWCFCLKLQSNFTRAHPLIRHPSLLRIFSKDPIFVR